MASRLLIEPFCVGSHKQLIDLLQASINGCDVFTLPGKKWQWKARTSALWLSQQIPRNHQYRVLFATSVLNLAELIALRPDLASLRKVLYFHENQLVYPVRDKKENRDFQFGYNQILSSMVADTVLFNSKFNMESFLGNINSFLKVIPDHRPKGIPEILKPKCHVLHFPIIFPDVKGRTDGGLFSESMNLTEEGATCSSIGTESQSDKKNGTPFNTCNSNTSYQRPKCFQKCKEELLSTYYKAVDKDEIIYGAKYMIHYDLSRDGLTKLQSYRHCHSYPSFDGSPPVQYGAPDYSSRTSFKHKYNLKYYRYSSPITYTTSDTCRSSASANYSASPNSSVLPNYSASPNSRAAANHSASDNSSAPPNSSTSENSSASVNSSAADNSSDQVHSSESIDSNEEDVRKSAIGTVPLKKTIEYWENIQPNKRARTMLTDGPLHIVWPHRWEHDKDPDLFFRVLKQLHENNLEFQVSVLGEAFQDVPECFAQCLPVLGKKIINWGYQPSKEAYYDILRSADCVVSTAKHEFFGVAMLEAVHLGCFPVCPNELVYPEIFPRDCLYNTEVQLYKKLSHMCKVPHRVRNMEVVIDTSKYSWDTLEAEFNKYLEVT